jgi:hypothetical protein
MVEDKLNRWENFRDELESLKSEKEVRVRNLDITLAKESGNKKKERNLFEQIRKEAKADENPLRVNEYAVEGIGNVDKGYEKMEGIRDHVVKEVHALDFLIKEIERKIIMSTMSFSNEEEITDKGKEMRWPGGEND